MKLFVYGTLMQDQRNHEYLKDAQFLGAAETEPKYELTTNGSIPAVKEGGTDTIKGELYEVDEQQLKTLDVLEEVDTQLYDRKEIRVKGEKAVIYLGGERMFASDTWVKIPGGDWRSYKKENA